MACCSTNAAISLKRVKTMEKLLWRAYKKSQTHFRTVPSRPPKASPSQKVGVCNPTQNCNHYISGTAKTTDCKSGQYIHRVHPNTSPWKIWEKRERGRIQGLPNFFEYPLLSLDQERVSYKLQIWQMYSQRRCEQKPLKNLREKKRGRIQGMPKFLNTPYYLRNG